MAVEFPSSPTLNDIYTDPTTGQSWQWDGTKWTAVGSVDAAIWDRTGTVVSPATAGDVVSISAGTAALPGLTPVGDPNTGIYSPGGDAVGVSTAGTERLRIDSAGNVGIGTTSPDTNLVVQSASVNSVIKLKGNSSTNGGQLQVSTTDLILRNRDNGSLQFWTNDSQRAQIDSEGRLLVGTSSSSTSDTLTLQANSGSSTGNATLRLRRGASPGAADQTVGYIGFEDNSGNSGASIFAASDGGAWVSGSNHRSRLVFSTTADGASSPTERMRINANGSLSSVVPGGATLYPHFACRAWVNFDGTGTVTIRNSGNVSSITDNGTGSYTVNFTTAMPDADYAASAMTSNTTDATNTNPAAAVSRATTSCRVDSETSGGSQFDAGLVDLIIFR